MEKVTPIRTAIVGLGNVAHGYDDIPSVRTRMRYPTHFSVLRKDRRFRLIAASDVSDAARRAFARKAGAGVTLYADYRRMLALEDIDLLVVAVPTALHYAVSADALRSGVKTVLCEKPITRTFSEAYSLSRQAKKKRATILVNYQRSYNPRYVELARLIRHRVWGRPVSVAVTYTGGVFNIASHLINLMEKFFGPIRGVQSTRKNILGASDLTVSFIADTQNTRIRFEGVEGVSYRVLDVDMTFERGRIQLRYDTLSEFRPGGAGRFSFLESQRPRLRIDGKEGTSMRGVYENVFQVMAKKEKPKCDMKSATQTLNVALAAVESARSGKRVIIRS